MKATTPVDQLELPGQRKWSQARRKRLGQYFSGGRVARLLAELAGGEQAQSAIDPMAGIGDMLMAVHALAPKCRLHGIEIDPAVARRGLTALNSTATIDQMILGSAFDWPALAALPSQVFDLVITNPPYVRYQSLSDKSVDHHDIPSAPKIRASLLESLERMDHLAPEDRQVLQTLARGYSGLADLAVPSWILCAAMTQMEGHLAMVVPESWLSREYARPIQYLLSKLFSITYVIEDLHRTWFNEAQVKTMLVVAKRKPVGHIEKLTPVESSYFHIGLPHQSMSELSLVGGLFPESTRPEADFIASLGDPASQGMLVDQGVTVRRGNHREFWDWVAAASASAEWFSRLEGSSDSEQFKIRSRSARRTSSAPSEITGQIPGIDQIPTVLPKQLGVEIGQGLRTGANTFFYVEAEAEGPSNSVVRTSKALGQASYTVPTSALRRVLRRQSEAPAGVAVDPGQLRGRVLVLEHWVHPSDGLAAIAPSRQVMPEDLAQLVTRAASTNLGSMDDPKYIPDLSAVKTNQTSRSRGGVMTPPRYWYMLPPFAPRHIPDLFVARVNSGHPKFFINDPGATVVDANFSTLWLRTDVRITREGLVALLNSTWVIACLEAIGAVLGGGALKVEATHLKRLPLPALPDTAWDELHHIGSQLTKGLDGESGRKLSDQVILSAFFGPDETDELLKSLQEFATAKAQQRRYRQ